MWHTGVANPQELDCRTNPSACPCPQQALFAKTAASAKLTPLVVERKKYLKAVAAVSSGSAAGHLRLGHLEGTAGGGAQEVPQGHGGGECALSCHPMPPSVWVLASYAAIMPAAPCLHLAGPQDPASQLAQLVALEHLAGVTLADRVRVCVSLYP